MKLDPNSSITIDMPGSPDLHTKLGCFLVPPGQKASLADYDPAYTGGYKNRTAARRKLMENLNAMVEQQEKLYAQDSYALLIIFQAMDAAGKDSAIEHVMSGVNPQGCEVHCFKAPSDEELDHDYLWRTSKVLPERGRIGIFNRSYYEEVLVVRVHPELLERQRLPAAARGDQIWTRRFEEINGFEKYLVANGIVVLKFFLNVSREEQRRRFLARIDRPEKNWKFAIADAKERAFWREYMQAYEQMLNHTSTSWAPWLVIPADNKWFTRLMVSEAIVRSLKGLDLAFPVVSRARRKELLAIRELLEAEG